MEFENSNKLQEKLYYPVEKYRLEEQKLIEEQKESLSKKIESIYNNLQKKKNIDEFLKESNKENELPQIELKTPKFLMIVLGIILFTFHLVSIYIINGIINAIEEELLSSAISYIKKIERKPNEDFYQNYNKLNCRLPDYSVFFISSFLSEYLNECLGYVPLLLFVNAIIFLILFFGFKEFNFNIERNFYKNYSLSEFLYLYFIYLILCIFQGFISLLPLKFIKDGFILYEKEEKNIHNIPEKESEMNINENNDFNSSVMIKNIKNEKKNDLNKDEGQYNMKNNLNSKENNNNKNLNNIENNCITNQEKNDNNLRRKEIDINKKSGSIQNTNEFKELEGFSIFYLISIILSILIKIIIDNAFIGEYKYTSRKRDNIFFIIFYYIFSILSLITYYIYWCCILKEEIKTEKKIIESSMKLCGYAIYKETSKNEDICCNSCYDCGECCEDCKICCDTLNLSLCFYLGSCKCCCKGIFCCDCNNKYKKYKIRTFKDINKIETVCVFYRITGRWNWLGKLMTSPLTYGLTLYMFFVLITNFGFEDRIWNNIEQEDNIGKKAITINIIILGSIVVYFLINLYGGKIIAKILFSLYRLKDKDKMSSTPIKKFYSGIFINIFAGILTLITVQTAISIILSGLIYFKKIKKNENYFLSITIGSEEYIKISLLENVSFFYEANFKDLEFISTFSILSGFVLIWNVIIFILNLFDINNNSYILFQFIIGLIIDIPLVFFHLVLICFFLKMKSTTNNNITSN